MDADIVEIQPLVALGVLALEAGELVLQIADTLREAEETQDGVEEFHGLKVVWGDGGPGRPARRRAPRHANPMKETNKVEVGRVEEKVNPSREG